MHQEESPELLEQKHKPQNSLSPQQSLLTTVQGSVQSRWFENWIKEIMKMWLIF